jgi:hypothetical protein
MSSAVRPETVHDSTDLPHVVRCAVRLAVFEAAIVVALSFITRFLSGLAEFGLGALVLVAGLAVVSFLPGRWTNARTIEGIAGAAGIGLTAAVVFLVIDVSLLQPLGMYTNRWRQIGGGSNWWYHPSGGWSISLDGPRCRQPATRPAGLRAAGFAMALAATSLLSPGCCTCRGRWTLGVSCRVVSGVMVAAILGALRARRAWRCASRGYSSAWLAGC